VPPSDIPRALKVADAFNEMQGTVVSFGKLLVPDGNGQTRVRKNPKIDITVTETLCKPS
jgi:hypothetical protein